ncbi:AAA family ATPase [Tropicimonas sediminicola]|uniref:AAA domain-containing protein n=1 Tax=Tropicimonas sediminicola TaxID=1031541 RepID=A0A239M3X5_9RHOB|nr:AAA family ATPase [Tropicimonas sediminicola]SNT37547.1 AAA domain-containing protein [Tropicimonas sediminicola]
MADGGAFTPAAPDDEYIKPVSIPFMDEDGTFWLTAGTDYLDRREFRPCILLGGSSPERWDFDREISVPTSMERMEYFARARVRWLDGSEGLVPGACLVGFTEDADNLDPPPLTILSYDDMLAMPDPAWLVQGVIQEATSALLFGKSNAFKSFLGIDLGCSVATGTPWHEQAVSGPAPVLYVATEGSRGVGKQRIPGWMEAHQIPADLRKNMFLYPQEIALDDDKAVSDLLQTCAHVNASRVLARGGRVGNLKDPKGAFALVVVDIFGASMMGPETSDETARAWVRNINRIMREVGCAVLTVAHTGWADDSRARMHTHFWGSFDSRMKAEGDKASLTTVLRIDRHKDEDSTGEWGFQLEKVATPSGRTTLVPRLSSDVKTTKGNRLKGQQHTAMQALSEALIEHGTRVTAPSLPSCPIVTIDQWQTMCERHGLTDSTDKQTVGRVFRRNRDALRDKGLIKIFDGFVWKVDQ